MSDMESDPNFPATPRPAPNPGPPAFNHANPPAAPNYGPPQPGPWYTPPEPVPGSPPPGYAPAVQPQYHWAPPPATPAVIASSPRGFWRPLVAAMAIAGIVGLAGGAAAGWEVGRANRAAAATTSATAPIVAAAPASGSGAASGSPQALAAIVDPAVVDINTTLETASGSGSAAGTGMILTPTGQVLTNNHVVEGSTSITVTIAGRSRDYTATVIGVDPSADVALIQIQGVSGLPTVTLASSSALTVGQQVTAIGNALGQGGTPALTQGAITALDQVITASSGGGNSEQLSGMIESDASISPGDSGGPLVNSAGQVIGMITAGQASGRRATTAQLGWAIPSDTALAVVNRMRAGQASPDIILGQAGFMGVTVQAFDAAAVAQMGLDVTSGVIVSGFAPGSPAEAAGMSPGSVITAAAGSSVTSLNDLGAAVHSHKPGEKIQVTWVDTGGHHTATLTLIAGPAV